MQSKTVSKRSVSKQVMTCAFTVLASPFWSHSSPTAREEYRSSAYFACLNDAHGNTPAISDCSGNELSVARREMERSYSRLTIRRPDLRSEMESAQIAWENYVGKECDLQAKWLAGGGSGEGPAEVECEIELTYQRASKLKESIYDPDKKAP